VEDELSGKDQEATEGTGVPKRLIKRLKEATRGPVPGPVPEEVLESARKAFAEKQRNPGITVHVARLAYDSWTALSPAGVRRSPVSGPMEAAIPGATRHQILSTAWHDIELWSENQTDDLWYLIGQVLPRDGDTTIRPESVALVSDDEVVRTTVMGSGEFHVPSLHAGTYDLRLQLDRAEAVFASIRVGM